MYLKPMRHQRLGGRVLAGAFLSAFVVADAARADGPTVDPRVVIARGNGYPTPETLLPVWEVDLAAAQDWAIGVFHQDVITQKRVAYSVG